MVVRRLAFVVLLFAIPSTVTVSAQGQTPAASAAAAPAEVRTTGGSGRAQRMTSFNPDQTWQKVSNTDLSQ
jgi:hypothetical protein